MTALLNRTYISVSNRESTRESSRYCIEL